LSQRIKRKNLVPKLILEKIDLVPELEREYSNADVQAEDNRLNDIIKNMKYNLTELRNEEENHPIVKEWRLKKNEFIRRWADALARKIEIGTWDKPIDWISTHISQEMRLLQFTEGEIDHVRRSLPNEYKREALARDSGVQLHPDLDETINIGFKDIEHYKPDELVDYVQKADDAEKLLKERFKTKLNNLELNKERAIEIIKEKQIPYTPTTPQKKDVISTIKPNPDNTGAAYRAAVDVYNTLLESKYDDYWKKLAEKLEAYPIEDKEQDREVARYINGKLIALESECRMLASFTDDKYAQNMLHWFRTLVLEDNYGKHAAAVMSKIKPKGETTKPRPLTRERVGDIKEKYWEWMKEFGEGMEHSAWWIGVADIWDKEYHQPYNADRRNRESPKLSETAFGSSSDEE